MALADSQIVARSVEPGWLNLAIGEPIFLQNELTLLYPQFIDVSNVEYPPPNGMWNLKKKIPQTHFMCERNKLVITNGAKQALHAALYASKVVKGAKVCSAPIPYWPSFPVIAKGVGLEWDRPFFSDVEILTFPNNPSGCDLSLFKDHGQSKRIRIWDAVYDSGIYLSAMPPEQLYSSDVIIHSASKTYGLSGLRVGWAWFKDQDMADAAAEYVENSTSGVSVLAQNYLASFLDRIENNYQPYQDALSRAAGTLFENKLWFNVHLAQHLDVIQGLPGGMGGMFAWFRPRDAEKFSDALEASRIRLVDGVHCNVPGFYRMNMGVSYQTMRDAINRLQKEL